MMKNREWNFVDKSSWGAGAWASEPDKVQWSDEATGLPCLAVRNPHLGHWCGYVGVAEGHALFGGHYDAARGKDGDWLDVHGGLTFSGFCQEGHGEARICHTPDEGEPERVYWLGFDCAHLGDLSPGMAAREREMGYPPSPTDTYRTLAYVKSECAALAKQVASL